MFDYFWSDLVCVFFSNTYLIQLGLFLPLMSLAFYSHNFVKHFQQVFKMGNYAHFRNGENASDAVNQYWFPQFFIFYTPQWIVQLRFKCCMLKVTKGKPEKKKQFIDFQQSMQSKRFYLKCSNGCQQFERFWSKLWKSDLVLDLLSSFFWFSFFAKNFFTLI